MHYEYLRKVVRDSKTTKAVGTVVVKNGMIVEKHLENGYYLGANCYIADVCGGYNVPKD